MLKNPITEDRENRENQVTQIRVTTKEREEIGTGIRKNKEKKVWARICSM